MSDFVSAKNCYKQQTLIIDVLSDGSEHVRKNELTTILPPCQVGCGCRALSGPDQESCGFDPKTGLCHGRMA